MKILIFGLLFASSAAMACPTTSLKCNLKVKNADGAFILVSETSAIYTANPSHCMARVAVVSPDKVTTYLAAASADGTVLSYTQKGGVTDYGLAASGNGVENPVVLENNDQIFTCSID